MADRSRRSLLCAAAASRSSSVTTPSDHDLDEAAATHAFHRLGQLAHACHEVVEQRPDVRGALPDGGIVKPTISSDHVVD
jgi:hypothetical protein